MKRSPFFRCILLAFILGLFLLIQCKSDLTINRPGSKAFNRSWTRALIADSLHDFPEAIQWYTKIIEGNYYERSTVNALTNRGRAKIASGNTLEGIKDLRRSISILPTYSAIISISAVQSNPDSSLLYCMRALRIAPDEPKVYYVVVGHYTLFAPNRDSALYYANFLLKLKPNAMMLDLLMTTYLQYPDPDKLILVTDKLISINPNDAFAYNNRGFAYFQKEQYDIAKKDINKSLSLDPTNSYAYRNLGVLFLQTEKIDSACRQFEKAINLGFSSTYGPEVDTLQHRHCGKK